MIQFRKFWKDIMLAANRKICCNAKQFYLVMVQLLKIHDVKGICTLKHLT